MSDNISIMNEFAKIFKVNDDTALVLAYYEEDKSMGGFFTVVMTEIDGERFVSENMYGSEEEAVIFLNTFLQGQAENFYFNSKELGEGVPTFSMDFLLEYDFDTFCDWVSKQDSHNLEVMTMIMSKDPRFKSQVEVLKVLIKK